MSGFPAVSIVLPEALASDPSLAWAAGALKEALVRRDVAVRAGAEAGEGVVVEVAGAGGHPHSARACPRSPRAWRCCARATASSPGDMTRAGSCTR